MARPPGWVHTGNRGCCRPDHCGRLVVAISGAGVSAARWGMARSWSRVRLSLPFLERVGILHVVVYSGVEGHHFSEEAHSRRRRHHRDRSTGFLEPLAMGSTGLAAQPTVTVATSAVPLAEPPITIQPSSPPPASVVETPKPAPPNGAVAPTKKQSTRADSSKLQGAADVAWWSELSGDDGTSPVLTR